MVQTTIQFDDALSLVAAASRDRLARAKQWHMGGGKVLAYLGNTIPLEMVHAAGLLPLHLVGKAGLATPLADQYLEPAFDPLSRSLFNRLLAGDYSFVAGLVLPRTHDAHQRLYYYLCELERKGSQYPLPKTHLLNLLHTPRESTRAYNLDRFREFQVFLEGISGKVVSQESLAESIDLFNRIRERLAAFNRLRADGLVSGELAYQVYAAVQSYPPQESLPLITAICTGLNAKPVATSAKEKTKIVLAGNGVDHPGFHNHFDTQDFIVVGDYHSLGNHFLGEGLLSVEGDLLQNLVDHYQNHSLSGRSFNTSAEDLCRFAQQQKATAILFHYLLKEEALSWHYPKQHAAATAAGLRTALLSDQPYDLDYQALDTVIAAFKS